MNVVVHEIFRRDDGEIRLMVSVGAEPTQAFLATYDASDAVVKYCSLDEELFMRLSDLAVKRFGNCAVYQMELMGMIAGFATGKDIPILPATLGTTKYCTLKPGKLRVLWNKLLIWLHSKGLYQPYVWTHLDLH